MYIIKLEADCQPTERIISQAKVELFRPFSRSLNQSWYFGFFLDTSLLRL